MQSVKKFMAQTISRGRILHSHSSFPKMRKKEKKCLGGLLPTPSVHVYDTWAGGNLGHQTSKLLSWRSGDRLVRQRKVSGNALVHCSVQYKFTSKELKRATQLPTPQKSEQNPLHFPLAASNKIERFQTSKRVSLKVRYKRDRMEHDSDSAMSLRTSGLLG